MNNYLSNATGLLYKHFLKPILFKIDPELVHVTFIKLGKFLGSNSLAQLLTKSIFCFQNKNIETTLDGIFFPNPVGLSAGFDYNGDLTDILPSLGFGWHTIGTITLEPYSGNSKPRLGRFPKSKALLVNKGLKNIGAKAIIQKLQNKKFSIPTGISIASTNKHFNSLKSQLLDVAHCFNAFENSSLKHSYYELNISCPNTFGGEPFTVPERLNLLLHVTDRLQLTKPMYVKMPIDQSEEETSQLLKVLAKHNVQGLIMGNLTKDYKNPSIHSEDALEWKTKKGNLSGKPTWERSNNLLSLTKKLYQNRFTIIGTGGIFSGEDAQHKLNLGADLTQLITGMIFEGPQLIGQINTHLSDQKSLN